MEIYYIGNDWEYQQINQYLNFQNFKQINLENLKIKGIRAGLAYLLIWTVDGEVYVFSQQEEKLEKIFSKPGKFIESVYSTFNSIFIHTFTQTNGEKNFELFYIPIDESYSLLISNILNTPERKLDLFSDNNERVKDIVQFNYILTQSKNLYQLEFDALSQKFIERIAIDLNKLNPNPVYNFSIASGNNFIQILSQQLDGKQSFSSFSLFHKGKWPVSYRINRVYVEPRKIEMKSAKQKLGIVDMQIYSSSEMSFVLIRKILSTENQLLNLCSKLVNCKIYSDIQIVNL